jgi:hypothetical protein
MAEAFPMDRAKTWSAPRPALIPHAVSRFFIRRLRSGNLLLVKHNPPTIDPAWMNRTNVSYPDGDQAADGRIYIVYDRNRKAEREVLLATFTEADVVAGKLVDTQSALRLLVTSVGTSK